MVITSLGGLPMPMNREQYEEILNKLLDPQLPQSERTDLLNMLRVDYNQVIADFEEHQKRIEKLEADNQDLIVSNSKLFRQLGVTGTPQEEEVEKKEFSETITLEDIEKGVM